MIKLNIPIIVEGKYDKITLENIIDAPIFKTDGFGIFKNAEKRGLIRQLAEKNGIIVMTDSDSAGNLIRSHLKGIVGEEKIINVYIPQIEGKEKRKSVSSKEGYLGVEGMTEETVLTALEKSGVFAKTGINTKEKITKQQLFALGLSGNQNAKQKREEAAEKLGLPKGLSSNAFLDALNALYTYEEFFKAVTK